MMWWWDTGWSWWGWLGMTLFMIVFWGLVIWAIIALVRSLSAPGRNDAASAGRETPEETLASRFARGDIDDQEYERRLETLRSSHMNPYE